MIRDDFVSYDVALLLQEKGFSGYCDRYYSEKDVIVKIPNAICIKGGTKDEPVFAPSVNMAMKWLREVHNLYICPKYCCFCGSRPNDRPYFKWEARILKLPSSNIIYPHPLDMCEHYETYEEAVEAALKYALENIITKEDKQ